MNISNNGAEVICDDLPIKKYEQQIVELVKCNQVVVVHGDTGSGKTTQIPQYLLKAELNDDKIIGITQPRKIGAVNMAKRVCEEMNCSLGKEVGYEIRFDNKSGASTKIKYMTDGILLNQCVTDRNLNDYGIIMIDEAHERMLRSDVLLGMLKSILMRNCDIKIIIASATLDTTKFSKYYDNAPILYIEGNPHDIEVIYGNGFPEDYVKESVAKIREIHNSGRLGDILVFLTGKEEIENCIEQIIINEDLVVLPLYSSLEYDEQQRIFDQVEEGKRKVVVATNIAETSITIHGIRFVIDCGYVKQTNYSAKSKMDIWEEVKISKAQADQRKGRAGRTAPGICYRLYSEKNFETFLSQAKAEMLRKNLSEIYLKVLAFGLNPLYFEFIDQPNSDALLNSRSELIRLDFLDDNWNLTKDGESMLDLPVEPMIGKVLLSSIKYNCIKKMTIILAMLTEDNVFRIRPRFRNEARERQQRFFNDDGDTLTLYNIFQRWIESNKSEEWCRENFIDYKVMEDAELVQNQLETILKRQLGNESRVENEDNVNIQRAIISGFYMNICRRQGRLKYERIVDNQQMNIHPSSSLFNTCPEYILYFDLKRQKKVNMFGVMKVDKEILREFPNEMEKCGIFLTL